MDRVKEAADIVSSLNRYRAGELDDYKFISQVCSYFDTIKNEELHQPDFKFLKFIANYSGIPQFYRILENFEQQPYIKKVDMNSFAAIFYESTLSTSQDRMLHKYQKVFMEKYMNSDRKRFFLSASTSFGKTHLVFEVIKKMEYKNVVLIFPTIALLSENFSRLAENPDYNYFTERYTFHTLSEIHELGEKNIFIYTPERFLSYIEKGQNLIDFDFAFVDEVYKIDNDYIIDEEYRENERDVAYRLAVRNTLQGNADALLAGPYMEFAIETNSNDSFYKFLDAYGIELLNYNRYEIVNKEYLVVDKRKLSPEIPPFDFVLPSSKNDKLIKIIESVNSVAQNSIVYCAQRGKKGGVEFYAQKLIDSGIMASHNFESYDDFVNHLSDNFSEDWIVVKALKNGIGIHHGLVPKFAQKEIVNLFNENKLKVLISTTTITEGVNTTAKNLIVMHGKKGSKDLKKFDAKNIAGRAGRFMHHYSGRVIDLSDSFMSIVNGEGEIMKHKNFDEKAQKDEIDLFYSDDIYLSDDDKIRKENVRRLQQERNIPDYIMESFGVISRRDKIRVYDAIINMTPLQRQLVSQFISQVRSRYRMQIHFEGFQVILDILSSICSGKFKQLAEIQTRNGHPLLTNLIHFYIKGGFRGSIDYYLSQGEHIDTAIQKTADFVYNTLKYQAVKYLGVFNLLYKYHQSSITRQNFENIAGIDTLLRKLEYNALTDNGRLASDFGVPSKIVDYYENPEQASRIRQSFDSYEMKIFSRIDRIISQNS